jgi:two-component system response regulator MprA
VPRLLLVDDDTSLLVSLARALRQYGFEVYSADNAGEALNLVAETCPDLIVLDVVMPVVNGAQLCRLIRAEVNTPVLMLTGLDSVADRVAGLDSGADDYLTKPFAVEELVARIRALLRRIRRQDSREAILTFEDVVLDPYLWLSTRAGRPLSLTSKEFRILQMFMQAPGHVFPREEILNRVWGEENVLESNVVDVHIASLRKKLEGLGAKRLLHTVHAVGYVMKA